MSSKSKKQKFKASHPAPRKCHLRTGDRVVLLTGPKDRRGKTGTVIRLMLDDQRALVEGDCAAFDTHHEKANPQAGKEGGRIKRLRPIHVSNLALLDPTTNKPARVRHERSDAGAVRVAKKSGHRFAVPAAPAAPNA
jgi:large subunit ribosomal protein L24